MYNAPVRQLGSSVDYTIRPPLQKIEYTGSKDLEFKDSRKIRPLRVDAQIFGKPTCIVNKQGIERGKYLNKSLNEFNVNELIDMSEKFSLLNKSLLMKRIFEQIERERNENEYNRTEVQERAMYLTEQLKKFQFDLN